MEKRRSGILMPVFSLPSEYGIGDFGKSAYKFVDYLSGAGQKVWQILPLVQTGYGNSPYSSVCMSSFNPYFISPELLLEQGLITKEEMNFSLYNGKYIDYGFLYQVRFPLLRKAFSRFDKNEAGFVECKRNKEFYDYALYMTIKYASGQKHFYEWEECYKRRYKSALIKLSLDYADDVEFWQFVQYTAKKQWLNLKEYANSKGITVMGDIPLYVALDSVDVWVEPQLFKLDENFIPKKVAGVPPDYFCADGQMWGNPVYDYEYHKKTDFIWWEKRVKTALEIFDFLRIDHFRGLNEYYEIDNGAPNARVGEWIKVPSDELFKAIHKSSDKSRIIAEDLGIIDDGVRELLKKVGYPGMKILSFAFNGQSDNLYLPQNLNENSVCFTGTHDNDTLMGLIKSQNEWDRQNLINGVKNSLSVLKIEGQVDTDEHIIDSIIELGFKSKSDLFIMPYSDFLKKDTDYRINEPGSVKDQNWSIMFNKEDFNLNTQKRLKSLTKKYNR